MLDRTYPTQVCSIARSLEVVGERWSLLIVRDAFLGASRFWDFQRSLGIARNVLTQRLAHLVDEGVFEHARGRRLRPDQEGPRARPRAAPAAEVGRPPLRARRPARLTLHRGCGGSVEGDMVCGRCGEHVGSAARARAGPGLATSTAAG